MVGLPSRLVTLFTLVFSLGFARTAKAEILFEGYSKIISGGVHVGFVISRYEYDPKLKRFHSTYFLKTGELGSDVTESLKASADQDFRPLSYEYTSIVGKQTKTIDAKFKGLRMTALVKDGQKTKTIQKDLPRGTFLSTFLVYLMLKSKEGLKTDTKFEYSAIAEEDAEIHKGEALVGKIEKYNKQDVFKVLNRFKNIRFLSFVNDRGEVLGTSSPANGIATELMAKPADAVGHFAASSQLLKTIFGEVPLGTQNVVSRAFQAESLAPTGPPPGKQQGVPPGQGIQIKGSGSDQ